jgi:hypothetical protein
MLYACRAYLIVVITTQKMFYFPGETLLKYPQNNDSPTENEPLLNIFVYYINYWPYRPFDCMNLHIHL